MARGRGQPTSYKPEYVEQARKLCQLGATNSELADFFGVTTRTINNWSVRHPEFFRALEVGVDAANARIHKALYSKATGYSYDAVKIISTKDGVVEIPYREHVPPDVTAAKFWLVNKDRDEKGRSRWLDKTSTEVSGPDGGPVETRNLGDLSDAELMQLRELVAKTEKK